MDLLLAGGTGLVGGEFLMQGLEAGHRVISVGRRPTGKASQEIVSGFSELPDLPAADAALCALGTTIRQAGSQAAFRDVDYSAVMDFATAARNADINHFLVVTAVGARAESSVFYSRIKGELERALQTLGFSRLDIIRPGLLLGNRKESRPVESLLQRIAPISDRIMRGDWRRYHSIQARQVAHCLLALTSQTVPGVFIHHYDDIKTLLEPPTDGIT